MSPLFSICKNATAVPVVGSPHGSPTVTSSVRVALGIMGALLIFVVFAFVCIGFSRRRGDPPRRVTVQDTMVALGTRTPDRHLRSPPRAYHAPFNPSLIHTRSVDTLPPYSATPVNSHILQGVSLPNINGGRRISTSLAPPSSALAPLQSPDVDAEAHGYAVPAREGE